MGGDGRSGHYHVYRGFDLLVSSTSVDGVRFATAMPPPVRWATHPGNCENSSSPTAAAVAPTGATDGDNNVGDDGDDDGADVRFGDIDADETATWQGREVAAQDVTTLPPSANHDAGFGDTSGSSWDVSPDAPIPQVCGGNY